MGQFSILNLSHSDSLLLVEILTKSIKCSTSEEFQALIVKLQELIPFDHAIAGLCTFGEGGAVQTVNTINISYPEKWLVHYFQQGHQHLDPIVLENYCSFRLQRWDNTFSRHPEAAGFLQDAQDFGLSHGYTHGSRNLKRTEGSLFSFSGLVEYHPRTESIIEMVTPSLHIALTHVIEQKQMKQAPALSVREKEILKWAGVGKTTDDIAELLRITVRTVYFHLGNIFQKLDVTNRTQAVAAAIEMGIIDLSMD